MTDLDPNIVVSAVIKDLLKEFYISIKTSTFDILSIKYKYIFSDFEEYLTRTYLKCNQLKLIINKGSFHKLDDIYVQSKYECEDTVETDESLIQRIRDNQRIVVSGFGGIGKTIFSKKVWNTIFHESNGKIPIFFELRQLNSLSDIDLFTSIRISISGNNKNFSSDLFNEFVNNGRFTFILDGFDELPLDKRDLVERQILKISSDCRKCGMVVSGRLDDRFYSWEQFSVYRAKPFDKSQVIDLINRVTFDKTVKRKFINEIVKNRFEEYESFLQTPLLALMMLMTFSQSGEVPDKKSVFYKYAFMTLFSWHDGSKEAFKRESKSGLNIDEFEKIFSIFCLHTYLEYGYEIDRSNFKAILNKCMKYVEFKFDIDLLIDEIVESVNLMYKEGDVYIFTHRSFQEYFCAFACINYFSPKLATLCERLIRTSDSVLSLMDDINGDIVDRDVFLPYANIALTKLDTISRSRTPLKIAELVNAHFICQTSINDNPKNHRAQGVVLRFDENLLCSVVREIKRQKYIETFDIFPLILKTPNEADTKSILKTISKDKNFDKSKGTFVAFRLVLHSGEVHYFHHQRRRTMFSFYEDEFDEEWYTCEEKVMLKDYIDELSITIKSDAVFLHNELSSAKSRVSIRDKSIDDILGNYSPPCHAPQCLNP